MQDLVVGFFLFFIIGAIVVGWQRSANRRREEEKRRIRDEAFRAGREDYVEDVRVIADEINAHFLRPYTEWGSPMFAKTQIERLASYGYANLLGSLERHWKVDLERRMSHMFGGLRGISAQAQDFEEYLLYEKGLHDFVDEYVPFLIHPEVKLSMYKKVIIALGRGMRLKRIHELLELMNSGAVNMCDHPSVFDEVEALYSWIGDSGADPSPLDRKIAAGVSAMFASLLENGRINAEDVEFVQPESMKSAHVGSSA